MMRPADPSNFVDGLIGAALIDGRIDASERKLVLDVARNAGLDEAATKNRMNELAKRAGAAQSG